MLTRHAMFYDSDKEHYKAQLRIHKLQQASQQLGFELGKDNYESDKWQWGTRRNS
jgi:hypothetical protein